MELSHRFTEVEIYLKDLQNNICLELQQVDVVRFSNDPWTHPNKGGGITKVAESGLFIEKGAVNYSSIQDTLNEASAAQLKTEPQEFGACGLSIIIHPESPKIPTIHMNLRYFELASGKSWFGGGTDLTPYYPFKEDFKYFHNTLKEACESIISGTYARFKKECDSYFTIQHRNEMRGIGGIFFDHLDGEEIKHLTIMKSVGNAFLKSYIPIVKLRVNESYTDADKKFQLQRRGRYVEFNLMYDRGTIFGLKSGGRVESILVSLPPKVHFNYNRKPESGSPQEEMMKYYHPLDWAD